MKTNESNAISTTDRVPAGEPFTYWRESDGNFLGYLNAYPDHWTQGDDLEDLKVHRNSQGRLACRGLKRTDLISNWSKLAAFCSAMADGMTSFTSHGLDVPSRCRGIVRSTKSWQGRFFAISRLVLQSLPRQTKLLDLQHSKSLQVPGLP